MFSDNSKLLTAMNSIIQENSSTEKQWSFDLSLLQKAIEHSGDPGKKNSLPFFKDWELKKLEKRIEKLEEQNDKLLCIVHSLFEKLFGEAKNLCEPVQKQAEKLRCGVRETVIGKTPEDICGAAEKAKPKLTRRETDIFGLLIKGLCAKEIAK